MSLIKRVKQRLGSKRLVIAGACALAIVATAGLGVATKQFSSAATQRDCDTNSIDHKNLNGGCGATSPNELVKDIKSNSPSDLKAIYDHYGLAPSEYSRFVSSARMGTVYRDGRVVVDGQTVATNAWSVGRHNWSGRSKVTIAGKTYYTSATSKSFASNSIPAMVMFDSKGKVEFAVLTACGNPVTGKPKTPTYACNELKKTAVSGKANTYNFSTSASAGNGAKIVKVEYDFGDGSAKVVKSSPTDTVTHTFTKSANVSVKVYVSLPGKQTIVVEGSRCKTQVVVEAPKPEVACEQLTLTPGKPDEQGNVEYALNAKANAKNATVAGYTFTFGDGKTQTVASTGLTANTKHVYKPGEYTANVSVTFKADGKTIEKTSPACVGKVTVKQPECKPGVPVGSPECKPQAEVACVQLVLTAAGPADTNGNIAYKLDATSSAKNATIQSYVFDFGDQTPASTVTSSDTTASVTHTYAPGEYSAKVTVNMLVDGQPRAVTSSACVAPVTLTQTPKCTVPGKENYPPNAPECKQDETCTGPNGQTYPKGSEQCEVCTSPSNGQTYPKGSTECQPQPQVLPAATELPSTGPTQVIGMFIVTSFAAAIAHRLFLRRRLANRQQ